MALKFGTSGVRGLVTEMTDCECYLYTKAFARHLKEKASPETVALAGDLRSSTPGIVNAVAYALRDEGLAVDYCGAVPTPAVTCHGMSNDSASIMVTGSHIPDDRNGIKFNMPWGEVLKGDETEISRRYLALKREEESRIQTGASMFTREGGFQTQCSSGVAEPNTAAQEAYEKRYTSFFPTGCLDGLNLVVYQHSSVARDILVTILEALGAGVVTKGRSDKFVAVDTEAVEDQDRLAEWVRENKADALVSTDGDGDRPLVVDEKGTVVRGDVLGILVADFLHADSVSAPISCNTALEKCGRFDSVARTKIGSPYVIESMNEAVRSRYGTVVGYEANGGFLTATDIVGRGSSRILKALPTRDAALPIIACLLLALDRGKSVSEIVGGLPPRFTSSGLLRDFPSDTGKALVAEFERGGEAFANKVFGAAFGTVDSMDFTDGARMTFGSGDIVHLRPSGNAPEFRCYTEASSAEKANGNKDRALEIVRGLT